MKLSAKNLAIVTVVGIVLILPAVALAMPAMPHQFYGTVVFSNGSAPDGLLVEAKVINGVSIVSTESTVTKNGKYGYDPLFKVEDNNSTLSGETIEFYVDGIKANETAIFNNGASTPLNLTIPGSSSSGSTSSTSGGTTSSGGASPSGGSTSPSGGGSITTTATTLSAAAQKVDANKDNKIDVLDFNTLMVNWGKTTANNIADFNGDSKVDVFDFNLLMINWTL